MTPLLEFQLKSALFRGGDQIYKQSMMTDMSSLLQLNHRISNHQIIFNNQSTNFQIMLAALHSINLECFKYSTVHESIGRLYSSNDHLSIELSVGGKCNELYSILGLWAFFKIICFVWMAQNGEREGCNIKRLDTEDLMYIQQSNISQHDLNRHYIGQFASFGWLRMESIRDAIYRLETNDLMYGVIFYSNQH